MAIRVTPGEWALMEELWQGPKTFMPTVSREDVVAEETTSLLKRAYNGSIGLLVNAMVQRNTLSKEDIDELYSILQKAEDEMK